MSTYIWKSAYGQNNTKMPRQYSAGTWQNWAAVQCQAITTDSHRGKRHYRVCRISISEIELSPPSDSWCRFIHHFIFEFRCKHSPIPVLQAVPCKYLIDSSEIVYSQFQRYHRRYICIVANVKDWGINSNNIIRWLCCCCWQENQWNLFKYCTSKFEGRPRIFLQLSKCWAEISHKINNTERGFLPRSLRMYVCQSIYWVIKLKYSLFSREKQR